MRNIIKKGDLRVSAPVLAGAVSVLVIIAIICTTVLIDKWHSAKSDSTPTDTSTSVTQTDTEESATSNPKASKPEESKVTTPPKTTESTVSMSQKPFTPQGEETPTDVNGKICYLTFDDGPSDNTLKILDILKKYNVKATFFVIGTGKLEYTKRMVAEGHTVALHSNTHEYSKIYSSANAYYNDLQAVSDKVEKACGVRSNIVRFPGGTSNTTSKSHCSGIMTRLSKELPQKGYYYFDWNVDSGDASGNNVAVTRIMSNIKSYGTSRKNAVVLMHDTSAKKTTVEALPQIIEYYMNAGYYLAPLSSDSEPIRHRPNN